MRMVGSGEPKRFMKCSQGGHNFYILVSGESQSPLSIKFKIFIIKFLWIAYLFNEF